MTTADLPGAVERLRTELDARSFAPADVVPVLSYMTVGDLRTILAALSGPYVPGMADIDRAEYADCADDKAGAHLFLWDPATGTGEHVYFTAVTE